ncbi:MAG: DUF86 domain-containing protein [Chloroflexi bacterium]|nr:DUF86 domain-containing protein [Chloroflexota bacterium]
MQPREWTLRIEDMLEAAAHCRQYVAGMDFAAFTSDQKTIDAVVRNLEIIGEAARYVPPEIELRYADIPWVDIRGMRHRIAHGYFAVDLDVVWGTATTSLNTLVPLLEQLLQQESQPKGERAQERMTEEDTP